MALDSGGNTRIDFAWGNFPMQGNEDRENGMGEDVAPTQVQQSGVIGLDGTEYVDIVSYYVPDITNFLPGETVTVTGFVPTYISGGCGGSQVYPLNNLNGSFEIIKSVAGGGCGGYGVTTPSATGEVAGTVYIKQSWASLDLGYNWMYQADPNSGSYYWTAQNKPRLKHFGPTNIGGTAEEADKYWSHTNAKESADLTEANNPFWEILQGYAGYPAFLPNDSDNVPGGVLVPNVDGMKYSYDPTTEGTENPPYAKTTLMNAGFTTNRVTTHVGAVANGDQWGDFFGVNVKAGSQGISLYGRESDASSKVPAVNYPVALVFNGCNAQYVPQAIRTVIEAYAGQTIFYVAERNSNGADWYYIKPIAGNSAAAAFFADMEAVLANNQWGTNWSNWLNMNPVVGISWEGNIGKVVSTSPKGGLTANAGQEVTVNVYAYKQNGQLSTIGFSPEKTVNGTDVSNKVRFYLNDGCQVFQPGDSVTISGVAMLDGCNPVTFKRTAFDGTAFNGTYNVIAADYSEIWVDADWSSKTTFTGEYGNPTLTKATWVRG